MWSNKDKQYFLDTIFRDYPCPAVFIHKSTDEEGKTTYHVVDGKQRLQAILNFKNDELTLAKDYGDSNLNGKKFSDLNVDQKRKFWDYVIVVDFVELPNPDLINNVFDRLNRNSKNLNEQELRHAKYSGWFINDCEKETEDKFWEDFKISTKTKAKRMKDVQFVSELLMILVEQKVVGFDQDHINDLYAQYESLDTNMDFPQDRYISEKNRVKKYLLDMETYSKVITELATTAYNFYTLWAIIALSPEKLPAPNQLANRYNLFMKKVGSMNEEVDPTSFSRTEEKLAYKYYLGSKGATTDSKQRLERFSALKEGLLSDENR